MSTQPPVSAQRAQSVPLLSTKLYIPPVRPKQVPRPRLVGRLNAGLRRKLTLVSAPAGFGKTTLVGEWVHGREGVAWVSLDAGDNDPARFWRYVIAALQAIGPTMQTALAVWGSQSGATEALLASLINDVAAARGDRDMVLVLDDYHLIENESIHDGLEYLLDHLPPALHVVITTREDPPLPLSRLRGRGQLVEIRAADLRFTPRETAEFLNALMGLDLASDEVAALERRTEGWIVGLQMAALSLQGQSGADRQRFVTAFTGDDHYVADYLVDEVLRRQPAHIQRFLVETSILDRLCGPLCDAILGKEAWSATGSTEGALVDRRASPSQAILDRLFESNLFVVSLDGRRRWFRYHRLFAELLYSRLEDTYPELVAGNHRRASVWYEGQGLISEAVSHAVEAADYPRAAYLVERYGRQAIRRGENWQHKRWVDALPEELVHSRPLLCMARAWALFSEPDATERNPLPWVERALEFSAANPRALGDPNRPDRTDHEVIGEDAYVFRIGEMRHQQASPAEVVAACQEALEALPEEAAFVRGIVSLWLAEAYGQLDDVDAAEEALAQARQLGLGVEGHLIALVIAGTQVDRAWNRGDLHTVARVCRESMASLIQPAERAGERLPYACHAYVGLGRTLVEWNELEQAEPLLIRGMELAELAAQYDLQVHACRDLALLHWIQGDYQEAHDWMDEALRACRWDPSFLHALRARIWLAQAEDDPSWLDKAIQWADTRVLEDPGDYSWELQSLVRVRIAQYRAYGAPDLMPVQAVLDEHLEVTALPSSGWQVQVLTLKALLFQALGRVDEAMLWLARALPIARETGRVLIFLEYGPPMVELLQEAVRRDIEVGYARQVLDAFEARGRAEIRPVPGGMPSAPAVLIEPLSERERQVLRLLATTLSGPEIADQLSISLSTFRSHTKSIYGKLDVHSRLDAVARATELNLLPN